MSPSTLRCPVWQPWCGLRVVLAGPQPSTGSLGCRGSRHGWHRRGEVCARPTERWLQCSAGSGGGWGTGTYCPLARNGKPGASPSCGDTLLSLTVLQHICTSRLSARREPDGGEVRLQERERGVQLIPRRDLSLAGSSTQPGDTQAWAKARPHPGDRWDTTTASPGPRSGWKGAVMDARGVGAEPSPSSLPVCGTTTIPPGP